MKDFLDEFFVRIWMELYLTLMGRSRRPLTLSGMIVTGPSLNWAPMVFDDFCHTGSSLLSFSFSLSQKKGRLHGRRYGKLQNEETIMLPTV